MKSSLDVIAEAFRLLNVDALVSNITGSLWNIQRPQNSQLEDVVINSLPVSGSQLQEGTFNVNAHVPNLQIEINGMPDGSMPDQNRLTEISNIIQGILQFVVGHDYKIWIETPAYIIRDTDGSYYSNTRVHYQSFQTDFII